MPKGPGAWGPADATRRINACAKGDDLTLALTLHARARLGERSLIVGDLIHLLKTGFVYEEPEPSTQEDHFKYCIEGTTPNSDGRMVRAVVIPDGDRGIKVVTIMWKDER